MITRQQAERLGELITTYTACAIDNSWKGGGDPEAIPEIERSLEVAHRDLENYILELAGEKPAKLTTLEKP